MRAQDIEDDLDAFVLGDMIPPDEPPPPPEDAHGATRLLAVIRHREREIDTITELAKQRIEPILEWRADRIAGAKRTIAFIERSLEVWMRRAHETTGSLTENLPDGELRVRPGKEQLVATDEAAAVLWARFGNTRRHWIRSTFAIDKTVAKKEISAGKKLPAATVKKLGLDDPPDTHEWCEVLYMDGTIVPGLAVLEPIKRVFGYTTNKKNDPVQQTMEDMES